MQDAGATKRWPRLARHAGETTLRRRIPTVLKLQIILAWLVFSCGHVIFWRRRDNIIGYLQAGFFFATVLVPVLGTTVVDVQDPVIVARYANLMLAGAGAYFVGLCFGAPLGNFIRLDSLTFSARLFDPPKRLVTTARRVALGGLLALAGSFALLGYIPLFAADRLSAKYGVGPYSVGFARGSVFYNVAMLIASTILPVVLAIVIRNRRGFEVLLVGLLFIGLTLTLNRQQTFIGPLVFLVALAIDRRWRPWAVLAMVSLAYVGSTLFNQFAAITPSDQTATFAESVAASAPDITDHIGFLRGFELSGNQHVGFKPLLAAVSVTKGEFNPATYALRIRTGLLDTTGLASGGLRLPAPVWGYASFGLAGAIAWSLISGFFMGSGTTALRRALTPVQGFPGSTLNLVLAWIFFQGTFGVVVNFFFIQRVSLFACALAVLFCVKWSPGSVASTTLALGSPVVPVQRPGRRTASV
jgi:hypothetical protein